MAQLPEFDPESGCVAETDSAGVCKFKHAAGGAVVCAMLQTG